MIIEPSRRKGREPPEIKEQYRCKGNVLEAQVERAALQRSGVQREHCITLAGPRSNLFSLELTRQTHAQRRGAYCLASPWQAWSRNKVCVSSDAWANVAIRDSASFLGRACATSYGTANGKRSVQSSTIGGLVCVHDAKRVFKFKLTCWCPLMSGLHLRQI